MKRAWTAALALVFCMGLLGCGKGDVAETTTAAEVPTEETTTEVVKEKMRVCVMYDEGMENVPYIKECGESAMQAAADFDVELVSVSWNLDEEGEDRFLEVCDEGYDLVVGTSAGFADWIAGYAGNYPETKFTVLDAVVELPNVQSVCFSQKEGYFLAGAAAAMIAGGAENMGGAEGTGDAEDMDGAEGTDGTEDVTGAEDAEAAAMIGWVTGIDIPMTGEWFAAYEQGAAYVNPEVQVIWGVSGQWEDSEAGKTRIADQMEQGADVVMYVPFRIEAGASDAMAGNELYVAEADTEVKHDADAEKENEKRTPGIALASVVRKPGAAVYAAIRQASEEMFAAGSTVTLSLAEDAAALEFFDFPADDAGDVSVEKVRELCEELKEKIKTGEIVVGSIEEAGKS